MEIKFLGTGGAFDFTKGTSAAVITVGGKQILIDSGFSTILKLAETGLIDTIDYVLITHLHADHVGSLPTLLPYCTYRRDKGPLQIIVPTDAFQTELHTFITNTYEANKANYISIDEFPEIGFIDTKDQHVKGMQSYAYYFMEGDGLIYYSGDIKQADTAVEFLKNRQEKNIKVFHETTFDVTRTTHALYTEIQEKLSDYETYIYHIDKANKPEDCTLTLVEEVLELMA